MVQAKIVEKSIKKFELLVDKPKDDKKGHFVEESKTIDLLEKEFERN